MQAVAPGLQFAHTSGTIGIDCIGGALYLSCVSSRQEGRCRREGEVEDKHVCYFVTLWNSSSPARCREVKKAQKCKYQTELAVRTKILSSKLITELGPR